MKALVGTFNQEKALVGTFSVIVQPVVEPMEHCTALISILPNDQVQELQLQMRAHLHQPRVVLVAELVSVLPAHGLGVQRGVVRQDAASTVMSQ